TGSMSLPIFTSPGRSGFQPQLTLSYDSGAGNGPFGLGWSLSVPSIARKTDKGLPLYDDGGESDVFILSGAEDLVPSEWPDDPQAGNDTSKWVLGARTEPITGDSYAIQCYRPRTEGLFARIEKWTRSSDRDVHWRATTKDGIRSVYGY